MNKTTSLRFFPVDSKLNNEALVNELSAVIGCQALLVSSLANITATDLSPNLSSPVIILVNQHQSKISELESAWTLAEKSGNTVVGAALVSN